VRERLAAPAIFAKFRAVALAHTHIIYVAFVPAKS